MATLRNIFDIDNNLSQEQLDTVAASGMGSLRRGYESGRLGTEANYNLARESGLRAGGDVSAADSLRVQTDALRRRAGIYAPNIQQVEQIQGIGDVPGYVAGQIGSGAASMQDPMLASTALTAVGTGLSMLPNPVTKAAGFGLRNVLAPATAYALNQRQLTGEQYGKLSEDPTVMANFTPEEINNRANLYGAGAAVLDTAIPGLVGRQLGGAGLLAKGAKPMMPASLRTGAGLLGEGLTETGQELGSQYAHGLLNPNRDTSGDQSALLNSFVGGAVGAGGPVLAGQAADAAFRGVGKVPGAVKEAAGSVVDMAKGAVEKTQDGVVDLKARLKTASADRGVPEDDAAFMFGTPKDVDPNDAQAFGKWHADNFQKRVDRVNGELQELAAGGDEAAAEIAAGFQNADPMAQEDAVQAGAKHILDRRGIQALADEAERGLAARGGAAAGKALGTVLDAGKAALGAFKGRKLNTQAAQSDTPAWTGDEYEQRKGKAMEAFDDAAKRADLMSEHLGAQADAQAPRYGKDGKNIPGYMREVGRQIADLADNWKGGDAKPTAGKFDRLRYDLNRMATRLSAAYGKDADRIVSELESMADPKAKPLFGHLREELAVAGGPGGISKTMESEQQAYDVMLKGIDQGRQADLLKEGVDLRAPGTRRQLVRMIESAANGQMTPKERTHLGELLGPNNLQRAIQAFAPRSAEQDAVESAYETSKTSNLTTDENGNVVTTDDTAGQDEEATSDFDKRQGQKLMDQRAGASVYSMQGLKPRTDRSISGKQSDPLHFSKGHRPRLYDLRTNDGTPEEQEKRQGLLKKAEDELAKHLGEDKSWTIEKRSALEDMAQREGVSLQTALGPYAGRNKVSETKTSKLDPDQTSERMGVNAPFVNKIITRYMQFMRDEAARATESKVEKTKAQAAAFEARANNADLVLKDRLRQSRMGERATLQTTPEQREEILKRAIAYLSNFGVVVAERATNRDPEQISADQVLALAEQGNDLHAASKDSGANKNDLLTFESKLAKTRPDGKMGMLYVRARDLVKFARQARFAQTENAASKNANVQYLADLSAGLSALVASRHVEGMPRGFEDGNIPRDLPLATTTYGKWTYAKKMRAKEAAAKSGRAEPSARSGGDARASEKYQVAVAAEQEHDFFVPDDTAALNAPPRSLAGDAQSHIIEGRMQGPVTSAARAKLDVESTEAIRAGLEQKRAKFIEGGATERGPRIRAIDAELAKLDASDKRREDRRPAPKLEPNALPPDRAKTEQAHAATAFLPKPAAPKEGAAPVGKTSARPSGAAKRKLNAQATLLHREIGRPGFAATHDSPIRHEGRFDWRKHTGKGEGNAAFGAGTYLSTGDGVHSYYKKMFTAMTGGQSTSNEVEQARRRLDDAEMELIHVKQRIDENGAFFVSLKTEVGSRAESFKTRAEAEAAVTDHIKTIEDRLQESRRKLAAGEGNVNYIRDEAIPYSVRSLAQARKSTIEDGNERIAELTQGVADAKAALESAKKKLPFGAGKSPTYQVSVDIPPERLLNWDKPLSEQSATVRLRALKAIKDNDLQFEPEHFRWEAVDDGLWNNITGSANLQIQQHDDGKFTLARDGRLVGTYKTKAEAQAAAEVQPNPLDVTGEELYDALVIKLNPPGLRNLKSVQAQTPVSDYLQSLGILGHSYAAANGSQGKTPNYVIYDDSKIHTNFVAFSKQNPSSKVSTQAEMDEARNYVAKVLGPQLKVDFKALTGYSGEWIEAQNVIEISTTPGPGTMQVAYHEALHAFFSKFVQNNPQALSAMQALADDKKILARVEALLAGHPNALAQLADGEERLAYMYQFWAAGLLDLPTKKAGFFEAIKRFFQRVLGMITDSERATAILEAFHAGKMSDPSVAGQVIAEQLAYGTLTTKAARKVDRVVAKAQEIALPTQMILANSDSATARKLAPMLWTNPGDEAHGGEGEGYINAKQAAATKYKNLLSGYIKDLSDRDLADVTKLLQAGKATDLKSIAYAPHREAVEKIDALFKRFYRYMTDERGMQLGKINDGYFPRVWDVGTLLEKQGDFIDMLMTKYDAVLTDGVKSSGLTKQAVAQRIFDKIVSSSVGEHILPQRSDGVLSPFFSSGMMRELSWLDSKDSEPFQSKDLIGTLTGYFHSGARAAEYTHRFGQDGEKLAAQLKVIEQELLDAGKALVTKGDFKTAKEGQEWARRRMEQVHKAVGAVEGTLGSDIGSAWRNTTAWITVYQNLRLLPLTLFASVVDPLGMVARGATMKQAYDTFLRGMKEVFANWGDMLRKEPKERQADEWEKLAMAVGSVDAAMFSHHVADEYSSMYMSKKAARLNDTFFRLNGMESWNRGVRVGATQAAVNFLQRHAKKPEVHSERWLKELGLTPADLTFNAEGQLITDKNALAAQKGISKAVAEVEMERVHQAIRRWVQGAVLTPNAAQRPAWSSDPHYSMFFHLKQFSYSFHQTILKRAVKEMNYGNMAPMGAFMWYVPVMIASDITKGLLQGGGSLPSHMQGMTLGDHVMRGAERSGLLSVATIGVDAQQDVFSLAGPAIEQTIDAFGQPIGKTIVDALPGKPVFAEALR